MLSTKKLIYHIAETLGDVESTYPTLVVTASSVSSLPTTISDANIESDMIAVNAVLSHETAQRDDWTVTTSAGSLTISGTIDGTTDITLYLTRSR